VFFTAAPAEANRVVVRVEPAGVRFVDTGAEIQTRTCRRITPHEALCEGLVDTLIVETGDGDDTIDGNDQIVAARGSGGPGNDVLRGTAAGSVLRGGPGNDSVTGGAGPDTLAGGEPTAAAGAATPTCWPPARAASTRRSRTAAATEATRSASRAPGRASSWRRAAAATRSPAARSRSPASTAPFRARLRPGGLCRAWSG
jgi:hypothetical protein